MTLTGGSRPGSRVVAADHVSLRRNNLSVVLRHVRELGPRSRARIAADTGLNKATVSSLVAELKGETLVNIVVPGFTTTERNVANAPEHIRDMQAAKTPTGRHLILVADQHLGFGESGRNFESSQPEFTLIDIRLGPDGKGVGKLAPSTKVTYDKKTRSFELENFGSQPIRLRDVRSENK